MSSAGAHQRKCVGQLRKPGDKHGLCHLQCRGVAQLLTPWRTRHCSFSSTLAARKRGSSSLATATSASSADDVTPVAGTADGVPARPKGGMRGFMGVRGRIKRGSKERSSSPISFTLDTENLGETEESQDENIDGSNTAEAPADAGTNAVAGEQLRQSDCNGRV